MLFVQNIITPFLRSASLYSDRYAFFIDGQYYSYRELLCKISAIRKSLKEITECCIGLVANDDLETYASIWALWLEGKCYVPLHPHQPIERCTDIIHQVGIRTVLDSSEMTRYIDVDVIMTRSVLFEGMDLTADTLYDDDRLAYILFTSGSTGQPKGVPITRGNVASFAEAFWTLGFQLTEKDHCMQMFDLTFDISIQSYMMPLLVGACVYTISPKRIKYEAIFELLDEHEMTFALMVPSVIHYLRPYLNELKAESMRYSLFAGEALPLEDTIVWSHSLPNARIFNVYGPTEGTIYCTGYEMSREGNNKAANGIISIGKAMKNNHVIVVDENMRPVTSGKKGELCLAGRQVTPGYWHNHDKNKISFFNHEGKRYYRTGDVCSMDEEGDILYYGRLDSQVKIQGFRIELSEIECVAKRFYKNEKGAVAIPVYDDRQNCTIMMVIEGEEDGTKKSLVTYLRRFLPDYMLPSKIHFLPQFPLNANNKIDRKKILTLY